MVVLLQTFAAKTHTSLGAAQGISWQAQSNASRPQSQLVSLWSSQGADSQPEEPSHVSCPTTASCLLRVGCAQLSRH